MKRGTPFAIGIAGGTGSGKTTLVNALLRRLAKEGACLLDQDSYYIDRQHLSASERALVNYDEPNAIDHALLLEHLRRLLSGEPVEKPVYCFKTHSRTLETRTVSPAQFILVEGLFAFWDPEIRRTLDLKLFVDADADLRLIRRARRDMRDRGRTAESVLEQYLASVRPMHRMYVEPCRVWADLVFNNNDHSEIFVTRALAKVEQVLAHARRGSAAVWQPPTASAEPPFQSS
ncbi:MAG TPA: uridine kinase [Candidatus Cybelea sp.]|nr:uridine kinase [Candidatus Cybelea sp.]